MTRATQDLDFRKIPYRLFVHTTPVESLEQAAEQRGQQPGQIVRSIVFRAESGEFIMALMAGPRQLSWPKLRKSLGQHRLRMANPDEVLLATGYVPGTVSPFGLPSPLRILIDRSVFDYAEISLGSGERGKAIVMASSDLVGALSAPDLETSLLEIGDWGG